jgi:hypothetical protein
VASSAAGEDGRTPSAYVEERDVTGFEEELDDRLDDE